MKKPVDPRIQNLATFLGFTTIENIDKFYNKKFQTWLFRNSHFTEKNETDPDELFFLKYDSDGNIINAKFSCATKDGILLTVKDFIDYEVSILGSLEASTLPFDQKKRIEYYKNYLTSKLPDVKQGKPKKRTFEEFLFKITDKEKFIQELKDNFPTEKGKSIRAMIEILKDEGMLTYGTKEFKDLHKGIGHSFNRNIGTYQSVKDPKKADLYKDEETISLVRSILNPLISKYKQTQS